MVTKLFVPERRIVVPKPPSYLKLDMAFAIGAGAKLMDKSRYRSHGTISGATWADGAHGRCLDFNPATPSYVEIPAAYTQLDFTSQKFSIIARIKVDALPAYQNILVRGVGNVDGYEWWILSNGRLDFRTNQLSASQLTYSNAGDITIGSWYTIGMSRDGANVKQYVNGVGTIGGAGTHIDPATCARSVHIGIANDGATAPFDGKIEFLRAFGGKALSESEHKAWHNALA